MFLFDSDHLSILWRGEGMEYESGKKLGDFAGERLLFWNQWNCK